MKNKERTAAAAVVVMLLTADIALAQVAGPDQMMKGVELTRASAAIPYNSGEAYQSLKLARAAGAKWVTIVPVFWMSDTGVPNVFWMDDQSPTDDEVRQAVRWAKQLSLKVFMKPEVHCVSGVWQGYHNPHGDPWFQSYWFFIRRYARIAQEEECEMLCVGSELDRTTDSTWERTWWTNIINWVKGEYLGPVTYAADWRTYESIPFWDSLDLVGINAYFPLVWNDAQPYPPPPSWPVGFMSWMWNGYVKGIESLRVTLADTLKPIIFTEIGYRSIEGCSREPWNDTISGTYDSTEQRDCYIAALHSLLGKPWFAGWFWHEWTTDPNQGGVGDLSYSPKGKPAQEVLRRWSAAIASQRSITMGPALWHCNSYSWPDTKTSLDNLSQTGAQWVSILPEGWMDTVNVGTVQVCSTRTQFPASSSDTSLQRVIGWARERGLHVVLKPHVDTRRGAFRYDHDPQGAVRDSWFDSYRDFLVHYAHLADSLNCELFCVGCEIDKTVNEEADIELWRDEVIPAVREVYSGPITFTEKSLDSIVREDLWENLDFVGVDAYLTLFPQNRYPTPPTPIDTSSGQTPNVDSLLDTLNNVYAWGRWLHRLDTLYRHTEKPIILPEIGYQPLDSSAWMCARPTPCGWRQDSSGTTNNLYAVCFPVDTLTGYAVGEGGVVRKTTNSGNTWCSKSSGTSCDLYGLSFPGRDTGYAVGADGTILRTVDGFDNWMQRAELGQHSSYRGVCFPVNAETGYVVGDCGHAIKTTNGGNTWMGMSVGTTAGLRAVHFPCRDTGYVVGDSGLIFRTTNSGATWTRCSSPTARTLFAVHFRSPDTGYAVGDTGTYLRSNDAGQSWSYQQMEWSQPALRAVVVPKRRQVGDSSVFQTGDAGCVLRVMRRGSHWRMNGDQQPSGVSRRLNGVCFPDSLVGFIVGDSGTILKTSGGGRNRIDFQEQRICYEATFRALWGSKQALDPLPWFYGFHWYDWWIQPWPDETNHETWLDQMTMQEKLAQGVVEDWFAARPPDHGPTGHHVRHYPTGSLDVVVPAGGKVNTPLVICQLVSHNWEEGGSADSARLLQEYYGLGDTVIAMDSTAWFPFTEDTTWLFLHGQGKYRFYAQYLDVPNKVSPPYPDFVDTVIVFDTVPASGSIVINGGARFATSSVCTLRLAANDSASGAGWMRFINSSGQSPYGYSPFGLVENGGFVATAGSWSFTGSGCGYDTSLQMRLWVQSPCGDSPHVRQFVPAESISAYSGDSCVLEASILAHVHDGDASGEVSF